MTTGATDVVERLVAAGLAGDDVRAWLQAEPGETTEFPADRARFSEILAAGARLLERLPRKARRKPAEHAAYDVVQERRAARACGSCAGTATRSTTR